MHWKKPELLRNNIIGMGIVSAAKTTKAKIDTFNKTSALRCLSIAWSLLEYFAQQVQHNTFHLAQMRLRL